MRMPTRSARTAAPVAAPPSSGSPDSKRRRFLFTLGVGSAGVAVSATAPVSAVADITVAAPAVPNDGYRETAHVRDYYRTAKL
jgi:dipeptidase